MGDTGETPNKYTRYMGEMIKKAREEAGMSQDELARHIYRKRLAVSEMENGKVEISAWTLAYLAVALQKPLSYFYPPTDRNQIPKEDLEPLELEIILHFKNIWNEDLQKLAISQVITIEKFDPENTILQALNVAKHDVSRYLEYRKQYDNKPQLQKILDSIFNLLDKSN